MRSTLFVVALVLGAACTGFGSTTNGGTPGNEPGPGFEMAVLGEVVCPSDVTATTCVEVQITNLGNTGSGTCTLFANSSGPGGDTDVEGPKVTLSDMTSGAKLTRTLAWENALPADPDFFFNGICDPGLRS